MRRGVPAVGAIAAVLLTGAALAQGRDENEARCKGVDPNLIIGGCTALIQSNREATENLAVVFTNRGGAYVLKGQYDRAIQDYDQAIKLNPKFAKAFANRGGAYFSKGQYDRAIQDYDQAIKLDPSYATAFNSRGFTYLKMKKFDLAVADFDAALKRDPKQSGPLYGRGLAKRMNGDAAGGNADIAAAKRLDPDVARAFERYGIR